MLYSAQEMEQWSDDFLFVFKSTKTLACEIWALLLTVTHTPHDQWTPAQKVELS